MTYRSRRQTLEVLALVSALLFSAAPPLVWAGPPFAEFVDPHPAPGNQFGQTVVALTTGNVVITSPFDDAGGTDAGAVYLFNGATGALISTLTGSSAGDRIGSAGVTVLTNGNYVIRSPLWDNGAVADAGAATWGNGTTGIAGTVSPANSLVGTSPGDSVGNIAVVGLASGNYVVSSSTWDNGAVANAGAVTWGSGATGISGAVSSSNSLVGGTASDGVGSSPAVVLSNGNYVVRSPNWDGVAVDVGAVTWGSGSTGVSGLVSASNSLVGTTLGDAVGGSGITALTNGNYVVRSQAWDNGAAQNAGAVTWGSGVSGIVGPVSAANSLVGTTSFDLLTSAVPLTNGNYVVPSPNWDNGGLVDAGAATWASGTTGLSGPVTPANSLVGTSASSLVGTSVTPLSDGNYVVSSSQWTNGAVAGAGAATWGNGTTGLTGSVSAANSLVGTSPFDGVGQAVVALTGGRYVVLSPDWDNGAVTNAGAATWVNGAAGPNGPVSVANSLVGSMPSDRVGFASSGPGVVVLANGNYVVRSTNWGSNPGAVTWADGTTGITGPVTASNSLLGLSFNDQVGLAGVTALTNGNYVVRSPLWRNSGSSAEDAGAATWGNGLGGTVGPVTAANSFVGIGATENVGTSLSAFTNGNYVLSTPNWANDLLLPAPSSAAGAVTWANGATGIIGSASPSNSIVGLAAGTGLLPTVVDNVNGTFLARFPGEGGGRVRVGSQADGIGPIFQPTVTSPTSALITGAGATLGGNVTLDGGATITERGVVYSETATNTYPLIGGPGVTKVPVLGTTGLFAVGITGLFQTTGYSFRAFATNAIGTSYTSVATFTTTCATITLASLPNGNVNLAYAGSAAASGGTGPYNYVVTAGSLPGGLALTASGAGAGNVTGTPAAAGTFPFDITGTDTSGVGTCTGTQSYSVVIGPELGQDFFSLTPCRILDTRNPVGPLGGPALAALTDRTFAVGGTCGIPADAKAISLNIAVTGSTNPGNIRLHPGGTAVPLVSAINFKAGQTRSNNAVIPLSALGELAAYLDQAVGTAHLILDVNGYFK